MKGVSRLIADIGAAREEHLADIAHLKRLLFVAERGDCDADCGHTLVMVCDGDFQAAVRYAHALNQKTENMLARWLTAARLDDLETRGAQK